MKKIICDFFEKYKVFLKYLVSAGFCFVLDVLLFSIFSYILKEFISTYAIIVSTILARVISSFINYLLNGRVVFESSSKGAILKYYLLVVFALLLSSVSVYVIYIVSNINETIIKIPVDIVIFFMNYVIQKKYIFKG